MSKKLNIIENKEKIGFTEKWFPNRDMASFPCPVKMFFSAKTSSGKTMVLLYNVLVKIDPPFKKIFLYSQEGDKKPKEYDDIDVTVIEEIPEPNDSIKFDPKVKTLLIIEDKNLMFLTKDEQIRLDRILNFTVSHKNLSVFITAQRFFQSLKFVRDSMNVFFIWRSKDLDAWGVIGRRLGLNKKQIIYLKEKYLTDPYDFLVIDDTFASPYPLRKNLYEIIDYENEIKNIGI